jgi:hypothetical protein
VPSFMAVAEAIAAYLANVPPMAGAVETEVEHARESVRCAVPRPGFAAEVGRDYSAILGAAVDAGREHGVAVIANALAALTAALPWHYHYAPRLDEADLADRIAFAELIGPNAPLIAPSCRIGFTLMAPSTFYPWHAHPAVELYLVMSGHAAWATQREERIVPPGTFVLHRTNEPHSMRTFAEPLLALYGWRGDIDAPAVYL